jgi:RNA polymerase sigma-70 factor (ECF subfamily)
MGNRQGAEDVAQEVWMKVVRASQSYRGEGKFAAWLMTIARTTCLSALRRAGDEEVAFDEGMENDVPDLDRDGVEVEMGRQQTLAQLKKNIDALPDAQRAVLTMWMANEMSYEDIARELGLSPSAVKSLLFRARQNLEKSMRTGT